MHRILTTLLAAAVFTAAVPLASAQQQEITLDAPASAREIIRIVYSSRNPVAQTLLQNEVFLSGVAAVEDIDTSSTSKHRLVGKVLEAVQQPCVLRVLEFEGHAELGEQLVDDPCEHIVTTIAKASGGGAMRRKWSPKFPVGRSFDWMKRHAAKFEAIFEGNAQDSRPQTSAPISTQLPEVVGHGSYDVELDPVLGEKDLTIHEISTTPRVWLIPQFATEQEMDELIGTARNWTGQSKHDTTGFSFEMPLSHTHAAFAVAHRMRAVLGLDNDMGGTLRTRHYDGSLQESHPEHVDWFEITRADGKSSNLIVTAMLNMWTTEEGGETTFVDAQPQRFGVKPVRGDLVVWYSCTAEGRYDEHSTHRGNVVTQGHKWTVTQFFYQPLHRCSKRTLKGNLVSGWPAGRGL